MKENHNHIVNKVNSATSSEKMAAVQDNYIGDHFLFTSGKSKDFEEDQEEDEEEDDDEEMDYNLENHINLPQSVKEEPKEKKKGAPKKRAPRKDKGKTRFSAYVLWAKDMRPSLSKENPNMPFNDLNKKLGELWKDVSTNQKYMYKRQARMANDDIRRGRLEEELVGSKNGTGTSASKRLKTSHMKDTVNGKQSGQTRRVLSKDDDQENNANDANGTLVFMDSQQNSHEVVETSESGEDEDSHDEPCGAIKCKQPSGANLDWVQCDGCDSWFHYTCVGMMPSDALEDDQEYMCMECTNHVTLPKIPGDNSCPLCGLTGQIYENKLILKMHIETHKGEPRYTCIDCGKGFLRSCHLVVHQRMHTSERPYECKACDQTFISASHLHIHRQNKHIVKKDRELGPNAVNEFWSFPGNKEVLLQVKNRELDLKAAAAKLRYSYRFTYSRYKEEYGNILHNTPGKRKKEIKDFWENSVAEQTLLRVKKKEIGMKTAAKALNCTYEFTYARYREVYGKIRKPNIANNQEINENGATSTHSTEEDSPTGKPVKKEVNNEIVNFNQYIQSYRIVDRANSGTFGVQQESEDDENKPSMGHYATDEDDDDDNNSYTESGYGGLIIKKRIDDIKKSIDDSVDSHKLSAINQREEKPIIENTDNEISLTEMVASISATKLKLKISKILKSKSRAGDQHMQVNNPYRDNEDNEDQRDSKRKHIKDKIHICSYCEYESKDRTELAMHLRNHTTEAD